ncbi:Clotting factor B [Chionoecetes opilio]|uniref:Clotting factor B n=1 Tax=Chionoecetes opilio TaxID=41210 RepID=A0A8J4Y8B2_CHIOP|nr:Clotting factor B [Chionoecetes opilio]
MTNKYEITRVWDIEIWIQCRLRPRNRDPSSRQWRVLAWKFVETQSSTLPRVISLLVTLLCGGKAGELIGLCTERNQCGRSQGIGMTCTCVLLLLSSSFALFAGTEASRIYFPGQLEHSEHEACSTHSGTGGTCERSCSHPSVKSELLKCGIKDSNFLYCCDSSLDCGRNSKNHYIFEPYDSVQALILRPEAADSPPQNANTKGPPPERRPGIPEKEFLDFINDDSTQPPGIYAAVGGIAAEKNAWPWMALVGSKSAHGNDWFCGGVLINEHWVLSALHCFLFRKAEVVRLGEHDYGAYDGSNPQDFDVVETVFYPDYKHPQAYHDIALLKLASKVKLEIFISPVCLPWGKESDTVITNRIATLTGWGDTEFGGFPSTILQEVNVTVFDVGQCDRSYTTLPHYPTTWPQGIGEETLCAGDLNGGRDACQGDSGGPLAFQNSGGLYVLAGIVSRGYGCGHKDYPGLYANMRHPAYLTWIKKVAFASP